MLKREFWFKRQFPIEASTDPQVYPLWTPRHADETLVLQDLIVRSEVAEGIDGGVLGLYWLADASEESPTLNDRIGNSRPCTTIDPGFLTSSFVGYPGATSGMANPDRGLPIVLALSPPEAEVGYEAIESADVLLTFWFGLVRA